MHGGRGARSVASAVLALVTALALTACGSGDAESSDTLQLDGDQSAATSPSPTAQPSTPAAEPGAIRTSFPDIGFEIRDLPEVQGADRKVLATWATFVRGHHVMAHEVRMNPMLTESGTGAALAGVREQMVGLRKANAHYRGEWVFEVTDLQRKGNLARVAVCADLTSSRLVKNGEVQPGQGTGKQTIDYTLNHVAGRWTVTAYTLGEESC